MREVLFACFSFCIKMDLVVGDDLSDASIKRGLVGDPLLS